MLLREKFRPYLAMDDALGFVVMLHDLARQGEHTVSRPIRYTEDPDDDYLFALALSSRADVLVSGDQHVLDVVEISEPERPTLRVLTPREFLDELQ